MLSRILVTLAAFHRFGGSVEKKKSVGRGLTISGVALAEVSLLPTAWAPDMGIIFFIIVLGCLIALLDHLGKDFDFIYLLPERIRISRAQRILEAKIAEEENGLTGGLRNLAEYNASRPPKWWNEMLAASMKEIVDPEPNLAEFMAVIDSAILRGENILKNVTDIGALEALTADGRARKENLIWQYYEYWHDTLRLFLEQGLITRNVGSLLGKTNPDKGVIISSVTEDLKSLNVLRASLEASDLRRGFRTVDFGGIFESTRSDRF